MRVLFDNLGFDVVPYGGVSRYLTELIASLRQLKLARAITPFFLTENRHLSDRKFHTIIPVPRNIEWRYKSYYTRRINTATTKAALKLNIGQLLHMGYYNLSLLEVATCPTITTVYDMIPELFPEYFLDPPGIHPNKKELSQRASAVICISHNTRKDLVRLFGIDPAKIFVTHLGIDPNWALASTPRKGLPERFILFVGNRGGYKNFAQLLISMSRSCTRTSRFASRLHRRWKFHARGEGQLRRRWPERSRASVQRNRRRAGALLCKIDGLCLPFSL